jgi:hypothetical protein
MAKKIVHCIVDNKPWCVTHSEEQQKTQLTGRKVQKNIFIKYKNVENYNLSTKCWFMFTLQTSLHGIVSREGLNSITKSEWATRNVNIQQQQN